MSVWSRLFGDKARDPNAPLGVALPTRGAPATVPVLPDRLNVTFTLHDLEGREGTFLSAVSRGLGSRRQKEIVFTLPDDASDDLEARLRELCSFYESVFRLAGRRKQVAKGELTHFKSRGLFGRGDSGLLYTQARAIRGVAVPRDALAAIAVDAAELKAALNHGVYRVLTRIGELEKSFPFPTWSSLTRASVANEREGESALSKVPRVRISGVSFLAENKRVRVLIAPEALSSMGRGLSGLPRGRPFAILTEPASTANAVLVWHPGQTEPAVISPAGSDGSRMTGSCLMVVPGGQKDEARLFEDGYSLLFSTKTWQELYGALLHQRSYRLELADGGTLELEWLPKESKGFG